MIFVFEYEDKKWFKSVLYWNRNPIYFSQCSFEFSNIFIGYHLTDIRQIQFYFWFIAHLKYDFHWVWSYSQWKLMTQGFRYDSRIQLGLHNRENCKFGATTAAAGN